MVECREVAYTCTWRTPAPGAGVETKPTKQSPTREEVASGNERPHNDMIWTVSITPSNFFCQSKLIFSDETRPTKKPDYTFSGLRSE